MIFVKQNIIGLPHVDHVAMLLALVEVPFLLRVIDQNERRSSPNIFTGIVERRKVIATSPGGSTEENLVSTASNDAICSDEHESISTAHLGANIPQICW